MHPHLALSDRAPGMLCLALLAAVLLTGGAAQAMERWRPPAVAGLMYPEQPQTLMSTLERLLEQADTPRMDRRLLAVVAPHSAYGFSGKVAAHAFKNIEPGQYKRVVVLAPSHHGSFKGCSIPSVQSFVTPVGVTYLDAAAIRSLIFSPFISLRALRYDPPQGRAQIHEDEHAIEVLLPFLQARLGDFELAPIIVGDLRDDGRLLGSPVLENVAETIKGVLGERTLLVVSTDMTHHGSDYGFAPFRENVLAQVEARDREIANALIQRDQAALEAVLRTAPDNVCGHQALHLLCKLLPRRARGALRAYDQSGRMLEGTGRTVGYAALQFWDPDAEPLVPVNPRPAVPISVFFGEHEQGIPDAFREE